jgi:adenylate cyclase
LILFLSLAGYIGLAFNLFLMQRVYVPWVFPGTLMLLSTAGVAYFERAELRKRWAAYVSPAYLEVMLRTGADTKPRRYEATVVFGDIRGFTNFSEAHPPERVIDLLDKHLEKMIRIIFSERGTIDKFLGDGVLALFGAPEQYPDAALHAVRAAWKMREASLEPVADELGNTYRLKTGFGICTGPFVLGHVGSKDLYSLTTIGDTVNLASRLQAITGQPDVIIDRATYELVHDHVDVQEKDDVEVKGKSDRITCYIVTGFYDAGRKTAGRRETYPTDVPRGRADAAPTPTI